jgi:hypothetical protein
VYVYISICNHVYPHSSFTECSGGGVVDGEGDTLSHTHTAWYTAWLSAKGRLLSDSWVTAPASLGDTGEHACVYAHMCVCVCV